MTEEEMQAAAALLMITEEAKAVCLLSNASNDATS